MGRHSSKVTEETTTVLKRKQKPKIFFKMSPILITIMLAAVVKGSYIQGNLGENSCPCGSDPISDVEECKAAAEQFGYKFDDKVMGVKDDESDIPLCNYCTNCNGPDRVHLSTGHGDGAYWMCKETEQAPYEIGAPGADACPSNCYPIFNADWCAVAATKFGYEYDNNIKGANPDDPTAIPLCNYCTNCQGKDRVHLSTGHGDGASWICARGESGL